MSSLICLKCNNSTLRWIDDPDKVEHARMKCIGCGVILTMQDYMNKAKKDARKAKIREKFKWILDPIFIFRAHLFARKVVKAMEKKNG